MLNIHTHLLDLIKQKKITTDEFIILLLISKRVNKKKQCFPSIKLLQEESTFGRDKVQKCIVDLDKKGFIKKSQRKVEGKFSSNFYTIKTNLIGIYINCQGQELEEEPSTENQGSEIQSTENPTLSINQSSLSINQSIEGGQPPKKQNSYEVEKEIKLTNKQIEYLELVFCNPLFVMLRSDKFPKLNQKEIELAILQYAEGKHQLQFNSFIINLERTNGDKIQKEMLKAKVEKTAEWTKSKDLNQTYNQNLTEFVKPKEEYEQVERGQSYQVLSEEKEEKSKEQYEEFRKIAEKRLDEKLKNETLSADDYGIKPSLFRVLSKNRQALIGLELKLLQT